MEEIDPSTLLSRPGHNWSMRWFDGGLEDLQLDIVGFLAILGEDAVRKTARLASLSSIFYLPRLMPAPHALLYVERPENVESVRASVTAVHSGNQRDFLSHVTAALFGFTMMPFEVRCLRIRKVDFQGRGFVRAALFGPVNLATMFGCVLSITLFTLSVVYGDGMSLIATTLLSLLSTLIGLTSRWHMQFVKRPQGAHDPAGDCVIRWPNGSYLVLKCNESLAHQLLFAPDAIAYKLQHERHFIPASLLGTLVLMISVIALANSKIQMQIAWAVSYVFLNIAHWAAAALPRGWNFSISGYEIEEEHLSSGGKSATFTEGLFKTILLTKSTSWVRLSGAVPDTETWREWLRQAENTAKQCRTSEDSYELPVPRALRRHGTWGKAHACGVMHETPDAEVWGPDKAFDEIRDRSFAMGRKMPSIPEIQQQQQQQQQQQPQPTPPHPP